MAKLEQMPIAQFEVQYHERIEKTLLALRSLHHGGTVTDVRKILNGSLDNPVSNMTVRRDLWFLIRLKLATEEPNQRDNSRWFEATNLIASPSPCSVPTSNF